MTSGAAMSSKYLLTYLVNRLIIVAENLNYTSWWKNRRSYPFDGGLQRSNNAVTLSKRLFITILLMNIIALVLYRIGGDGNMLGIGGAWRHHENVDAEILASGVFVGYFLFSTAVLISYYFVTVIKYSLPEIILSLVGILLWLAIGIKSIFYWLTPPERVATATAKQTGIALGALCIATSAAYVVDVVLAIRSIVKKREMG